MVFTDGLGVAIVFLIIASATVFTAKRLYTQWGTFEKKQRAYALTTFAVSLTALFLFFYFISTSPEILNNRQAKSISRKLQAQPPFETVDVKYHKTKIHYLMVTGNLRKTKDLESLRQQIQDCEWAEMDRIYWIVNIAESGNEIYEYDEL